jgi:large subunit ribosomal protein L18
MSRLTPKTNQELRARRHRRIRAKVKGTAEKPRLALFRSNRALYVQVIDDERGVTLANAKGDDAVMIGKAIAEKVKAKGISAVVFDRGGFRYTGSVRTLAEAARAGGLTF